jgi:hypothetical protein
MNGNGAQPKASEAHPYHDPFTFWAIISAEKPYATGHFLQALQPDGVIVEMRARTAPELAAAVQRIRACHLKVVADPVTYFSQEAVTARYSKYRALPWGTLSPPAISGPHAGASRHHFCRLVLNHLISPTIDADVVIAPYFAHRLADTTNWTSLSMACAAETVSILAARSSDRVVWSGAGITEAALLKDPAVATALQTCPTPVLYLLVKTSQTPASPLRRRDVIQALEATITNLAARGVSVIVGRRFSSGLVLGGLGASGWTTGVTSLLQNFSYASSTGGGGAPPRSWFYVPELFNSVTLETRVDLHTRGFLATQLAPGPILGVTAIPMAVTVAHEQLLRHNLIQMRRQAVALSAIPPAQRRAKTKADVAASTTAYAPLPPLSPAESGDFLADWDAVL